MRIPLLFLVLLALAGVAHARQYTNSVKNFPATVQSWISLMQSDAQEVPQIFIASQGQHEMLIGQSIVDGNENASKERYARMTRRIQERYREFKKDLGKIERVLSWDTLSFYSNDRYRMMYLTVVVRTSEQFTKKIVNRRIYAAFTILGDKLLMTNTSPTITSDLHYDLQIMYSVNSERASNLYRTSDDYVFRSSEQQVIPYRAKKKWGLKSLQGNVVIPAAYDTIFKFQFGHYRVVSRKGYNLLDENLKLVYAQMQSHIRKGEDYYEVLTPAGYKIIGSPAEIMFEEPMKERQKKRSLAEELSAQYYRNPFRKYTNRDDIIIRHNEKDSIITVFRGYDYLDAHDVYLAGRDTLNNTVVAEYTGKIVLKTADVGRYESPGYEQLYNKKTRLFGVYCPYTNVLIQPKYRYIEPVDRDRFLL